MVPPLSFKSNVWKHDPVPGKLFWNCSLCGYDYAEAVRCPCKVPENIKSFPNQKGKAGKGKAGKTKPLLDAGAGDVAIYQQGTAGWDATPAAFRETVMREAAGQLRSDARLAFATLPFLGKSQRGSLAQLILRGFSEHFFYF